MEHLGYPSDPQLERKHVCREVFTLDKWTNMTAYRFEQSELPQPTEILAARRASPDHIPEGIPIASPTISRAPPITPASSKPSTSAEPRMAIPILEYRDLCRILQTFTASQSSLAQEMAAIRARHEQMLTTQCSFKSYAQSSLKSHPKKSLSQLWTLESVYTERVLLGASVKDTIIANDSSVEDETGILSTESMK
ncbi:hypothetical protein VitviT2T_024472 [Vitis vinifera]|uniref:Uncharacterized protein n=2 Tax=Vitis vinifera TaxID=29760 RepID=A0ABY9DG30_VITVI|nr:hypothetical protein VitviT2T_024472 [Vitis vinifera]